MISLKKHVEMYDAELTDALLSAWVSALESTAKFVTQAAPCHGPDFSKALTAICTNLAPGISMSEVSTARTEVQEAISACGDAVAQSAEESVNQIRQIMLAVASSAADIAQRDSRYSGRFLDLAARVQDTARLSDLRAMRQAVTGCAAEMKSCVRKMADEGARSLAGLKAEIETYREKLDDYQKRDATDPLTGLASRTAVESRIQDRMIWRSEFCLVILDMNGFKRINDTHGHAAGDELLQKFSGELRPLIRSTDLVGRWGGDEFVIVMDARREEAQMTIDRVCDWAFGEYELNGDRGLVSEAVSAAVGIAQWDGVETSLDLFKRADQLMYADKRTTRITGGHAGRTRYSSSTGRATA